MVLNPSSFEKETSKEMCEEVGGILPEPRTSDGYRFLSSLNTRMFHLGMSDESEEGRWLWDSDGSPVIWTNWESRFLEPTGGRQKNCAIVSQQLPPGGGLKTWNAADCEEIMRGRPQSTVCQRKCK